MEIMTEESFQQARKLMQKANYMRGMITTAKGNVAKWSNIESSFREKLQPVRADGAKKMLDIAMDKLKVWRDKFAALNFPDANLVKEVNRCKDCGCKIADGNTKCAECLCEDASSFLTKQS